MNFHYRPIHPRGVASRALLAGLVVGAFAGIQALAYTTNDAGTIFNSYAKAFYALSDTNGYFKDTQIGGMADFWKQAEEIECVIDAYECTSNAAYKEMIVCLLNGFVKNHGNNWASNIYNDDCMWASIAFARGYQDTGEKRFKAIARENFDLIYTRSWDSAPGGGLYWTTANSTKNACINGPGGIAACLLYQIYGDTNYLARAREIFNWERAHLFIAGTGAVCDGMDTNGKVNPWTSTYNQGTFIGLANFLDETNDAMLAANFTKDQMRYSGILPSYGLAGNNSGFNAIFLRWLAKFIKDRALQNTFEKWLQKNAGAAWNVRRTSDDLSWCQWHKPTPDGKNLHSWDCIASLEALQVVPPTLIVSSAPARLNPDVTQTLSTK